MSKYKVWFIDEDPNQWVWFYDNFSDIFDVQFIDASIYSELTPNQLITLALEYKLDLLIVDFSLEAKLSYNWDKLEEAVNKINPHFPFLISTTDSSDALNHINNPEIVFSKKNCSDPEQWPIFKKQIIKIIEKYQNTIIKYESELMSMKEKINSLTPEEENRYVEINRFLSEIWGDFTSSSFYSISTNKKLDEVILLTEDLLSKLWENA